MIEIAYSSEKEKLKELPKEVVRVIQEILVILDSEYGVERDKYSDDGGYVIVVENEQDFEKNKNCIH